MCLLCTQAEHVRDLEQAQKAQDAEAAALRAEASRVFKQLQVCGHTLSIDAPKSTDMQSSILPACKCNIGRHPRGDPMMLPGRASSLGHVHILSHCADMEWWGACRVWSERRTPCMRSCRPAGSRAQMQLQKCAAARQLPWSTPKR